MLNSISDSRGKNTVMDIAHVPEELLEYWLAGYNTAGDSNQDADDDVGKHEMSVAGSVSGDESNNNI